MEYERKRKRLNGGTDTTDENKGGDSARWYYKSTITRQGDLGQEEREEKFTGREQRTSRKDESKQGNRDE